MDHIIRKNNEPVKIKHILRNHLQMIMILLCEGFTLFTLLLLIYRNDMSHIITCIATFALVLIPLIVEHLFSVTLTPIGCVLVYIYTLFHMLGECYKLYYITDYWDKFVHASSGVVFALVGLYMIIRLCRNKVAVIVCALFALCFSVTISVFWEFAEFTCDRLFGMDTQNDTVITEMNTYLLGNKSGEMGRIEEIHEVTVNGQALPFEGYIDIGLIDTMTDMLVETIGAFAVVIPFYILNKKRSYADGTFFSRLLKFNVLSESSQ